MIVDKLTIENFYTNADKELLLHCTLCPRECGADRFEGGSGYCGSDAGTNIASICIHRGEEPPISGPDGICNIFFSGCNLRCTFCQNHEISHPDEKRDKESISFDEAIGIICGNLDKGIRAVGFVSPSHVVPQVRAIIKALNELGYKPITVYNTNGYDKRDVITGLDGMIDVYLPDYKYYAGGTAEELSDAVDYPEIALSALREMYYQKGSVLSADSEGRADNGILVRHLVLPGHAEESRNLLRTIASEISTGMNISLMSQYYPTFHVRNHPELGRTLYASEYDAVTEEMENLGFRNGWLQDMSSQKNYRPDFKKRQPFG